MGNKYSGGTVVQVAGNGVHMGDLWVCYLSSDLKVFDIAASACPLDPRLEPITSPCETSVEFENWAPSLSVTSKVKVRMGRYGKEVWGKSEENTYT